MLMKCRSCPTEDKISMHKDGYEVIAFTCAACREKDVIRKALVAYQLSNFKRVTLQNGDWYYVPRTLKKAS